MLQRSRPGVDGDGRLTSSSRARAFRHFLYLSCTVIDWIRHALCVHAELHVKDGVASEHFVQANFHIEVLLLLLNCASGKCRSCLCHPRMASGIQIIDNTHK